MTEPSMIKRRYGWRPDKPSVHDHLRAPAPYHVIHALPDVVDLEPLMPPVYDQGETSSCTGNAIAAAVEYNRKKQGLTDFIPSRLFIYYNERALEGDVAEDDGAEIRDGIKVVASLGACSEDLWAFDPKAIFTKPTDACYTAAKTDLIKGAMRVQQTTDQMRAILAGGEPIVMGFTCYDAFDSDEVANTGVLNLPTPSEKESGGHAILVVGYDHSQQRFKVRNSWGPDWGGPMKGYFTVPYAYFTNPNLADDLWVIESVGA